MKAREGDFIETIDGNIFDVKDLVHPPNRIIAFIRYTPDPEGERKKGNVHYRKVYSLNERYVLLREKFPQYLCLDSVFNQLLSEVPVDMVKKHYDPSKFLGRLRSRKVLHGLEQKAVHFAELLRQKSHVEWADLGVSGSLLVGLHAESSDIDLLVYGSNNGLKVYEALKSLVGDKNESVKSYDKRDLKNLFDFRSKDTAMKFEDFVRTESRKVLQGKFCYRDYFIRCVKDWNEVLEPYGSVMYDSLGDAKIRATVIDDSQMIFTPCTYQIENVELLEGKKVDSLREIVSFRGRFCEQARNGESVVASGMLERVTEQDGEEHQRLLLGNKPSDFMILT